MKKLIVELFNEYERPQTNHIYTAYEVKENMNRLDILQEFIQWLVDNDKIDLDKLKDNISFTMLTHSIGLGCEWHTAHEGESILKAIGTNAIIAYLSIQDEPIEFLISILK